MDAPASPAAPPTAPEVTRLLHAWNRGESQAAERLTELVYAQVRAIAGRHLRQFDQQVTLAPTELAHELFMRPLESEVDWRDPAPFLRRGGRGDAQPAHRPGACRASEGGGAQVRVTLSAAENQPAEVVSPGAGCRPQRTARARHAQGRSH